MRATQVLSGSWGMTLQIEFTPDETETLRLPRDTPGVRDKQAEMVAYLSRMMVLAAQATVTHTVQA